MDAEFDAAWKEALETAIDRLEEEAWRRAIEGEEEYVVSGGRIVLGPDKAPLKKRRRSDIILLTLLRAHRDKFRGMPKGEPPATAVDTSAARERLRRLSEER
jgi:hypothetical protein